MTTETCRTCLSELVYSDSNLVNADIKIEIEGNIIMLCEIVKITTSVQVRKGTVIVLIFFILLLKNIQNFFKF